jgi:hypothetical protein
MLSQFRERGKSATFAENALTFYSIAFPRAQKSATFAENALKRDHVSSNMTPLDYRSFPKIFAVFDVGFFKASPHGTGNAVGARLGGISPKDEHVVSWFKPLKL